MSGQTSEIAAQIGGITGHRARRLGPLARRAGWNVADQVMSAGSNFALSVAVARVVDANSFGAFSIAFVAFGLANGVQRAVVGQPLQIRHSADLPDAFRINVGRALGATAVLGIAMGALAAGAGAFVSGEPRAALWAVAACLPALVLQDACRMAFFAARNPRGAFVLDLVWTVLLALGLAVAVTVGLTGTAALVLIWGLSAAAAVAVGLAALHVRPRVRMAVPWARDNRSLAAFLTGEFLLGVGVSQAAILVTGALAGAAAAGSLRGAQVLLGPVGILGAAVLAFAVPELVKRRSMPPARRLRAGALVSVTVGVTGLVYLAVVLLLPEAMGRTLLKDTWPGARSVLLPMGLVMVCAALGAGAGVLLYSGGHARHTFLVNSVKAPLLLAAVVFGAVVAGAWGTAVALAAVEAAMLPAWLWVAWRKTVSPTEGDAAVLGARA
ncbi:MAG: hypothetical protein V9F82_00830 [Dermatophilaceae bacterium]